jgi:predicted nuclease of predicted toxin-antitoxin system
MKAVIDEDLSRSFGKALSKLGWVVMDIRDHGLRGKSDLEVYGFAQKQKAVLFSGDLGFASIISFPPGVHNGICVLRFPNEMPTALINSIVQKQLLRLKGSDLVGNLVILSPGKVRVRRA